MNTLMTSLGNLHVANTDPSTPSKQILPSSKQSPMSPVPPPQPGSQRKTLGSRNNSTGSLSQSSSSVSLALTASHLSTNDNRDLPKSRNSSRLSYYSTQSSNRLPDVADPTFNHPPTRNSMQPQSSSINGDTGVYHPGAHSQWGSLPSERTGQSNGTRTRAMLVAAGEGNPITPPRKEHSSSNHHQRSQRPSERTRAEEWADRGAAVLISDQRKSTSNGTTTAASRVIKKGVKDFQFGRTLGEGSYSNVLAATDRQTLKEYAIKILDKRHIIKEKKTKYVNIEKNTLNRLGDHPGIVKLYFTFQDERSLYFVLDLAINGELLGLIKKLGTFNEECTRYYSALILDSLEYMHTKGVIHRDLKPENILLDSNLRIKITDFGTAKLLDLPKNTQFSSSGIIPISSEETVVESDTSSRANSFVGTAEYVSPELLTDKSACKSSDLWAFGCIIYQFLAGRPPFKASNEFQTFQKIVHLDYDFPNGFPEQARDLVEKLLVLDPERRLSIKDIKRHPFFEGIDWTRQGLWKMKPPRLRPLRQGVVASFGTAPLSVDGPEQGGSDNFVNGTGEPLVIPGVPAAKEESISLDRVSYSSSRKSGYGSSSEYPAEGATGHRQSAPPPPPIGTRERILPPQQNRHSYHSLPRHSVAKQRSHPRLSMFSTHTSLPFQSNSSVDDFLTHKWIKTLNLQPGETIVKIGRVVVHSQKGAVGLLGQESTPSKIARKMFGIKKERVLILTSEGRAFLASNKHDTGEDEGRVERGLETIQRVGKGLDKKLKGVIPLDRFSVTTLEDEAKGKMWSVETGATKLVLEDPTRQAIDWVEAFQKASSELPEPAGAYLTNVRYTQSMDLAGNEPKSSNGHGRDRSGHHHLKQGKNRRSELGGAAF